MLSRLTSSRPRAAVISLRYRIELRSSAERDFRHTVCFVARTALDTTRARNTFSRGYSRRYLITGFNCFLESLFPSEGARQRGYKREIQRADTVDVYVCVTTIIKYNQQRRIVSSANYLRLCVRQIENTLNVLFLTKFRAILISC